MTIIQMYYILFPSIKSKLIRENQYYLQSKKIGLIFLHMVLGLYKITSITYKVKNLG